MNAIWNAFIHNRAYINDMTSEEAGRTVKAVFSRLASENSTIELGTKEADVVDEICKEILGSNAPTTGNDFEVHAEITARLTQQDVDDIMVSALEGGICYWSDCAEVVGCYLSEYASGQISRGGKLKIHVDEPFDEANTEWYELDMEKFAQGFRLWLENGGDRYGAVSNGEVDTCEIDGEMADLIIQYALFGEVVYG